ncbi:MAG: phage tail sheath family protein [Nostoc sp. GBBB01]|jgi:phage tail sheath protein FI|uniref:Phage tail sheath family protein n=1 Tax=Nostoc punctiforme FACHB-252 TaxID=1357509 RepID=A0ABR8HAF4_NOSPU|nr:phage tail sheath C-terminal domain-containing protein [Nostoc punctiforme]MBD2612246.1 phage tail sheath family protein [Nostoc punctiforme FACHB-252]MBL1201853.1 phage tail sheath family protein [Nostoc sp. GBBB01]
MVTYKTPNVYVEEISTFPPSVADVSTAIPAFIGYTEKAQKDDEDLTNKPTRISSLLEYETLFGKAQASNFEVTTDAGGISSITTPELKYLMYYALRLFFDNGGGSCYIISVGQYGTEPLKKADFETGLSALAKEDEPTLILLTDAVNLSEIDYYALCQQTLKQCNKLKDRFAIFDILQEKKDKTGGVDKFRDAIGIETDELKYGAAYYPYLQTSLNYYYTDDSVTIKGVGDTADTQAQKLTDTKTQRTDLYNKIQTEISKKRVVLPPSAAVAGVYARVDRDKGVWKAPANVSLASILAPTVKISNEEQENLNIDPTAGKSINAIRSFTGKGTLIWGARTLAGNDNEWRYIPVRRLFNLIEESIQKATAFVVFESNNAITWLKVKSLIESYLEGLWRQGALAGSTPEQAYFVNIGLGKSMTAQDILEGRMIVEIGLAAVRPAEFIILKFSHKLQEA